MYEITGIIFAWLVLGFAILLPLWCLMEVILDGVVHYATADQHGFPDTPMYKLWCAMVDWVDTHDIEPVAFFFYLVFIAFTGFFGLMDPSGGHKLIYNGPAIHGLDLWVYALFGLWARIGTFLAPVLIVITTVTTILKTSRKFFQFKARIERKLKEKEK